MPRGLRDLDEVYRVRRSRSGAARAGLWYAGQVFAISVRAAAERLGDVLRFRGVSVGLDLKLGLRMLVKYPMLTSTISAATRTSTSNVRYLRNLTSLLLIKATRPPKHPGTKTQRR